MRYVRQYDPTTLADGGAGDWIIDPCEGLGLSARLRRGTTTGGSPYTASTQERYALILEGTAELLSGSERAVARKGELIFVPAGSSALIEADGASVWMEIEAPVDAEDGSFEDVPARVVAIDQARFEGGGFAYQSVAERSTGARTMRINVLQVQPGSGSPDYHIHRFAQIYIIQEGEMTLDIGRSRTTAKENSVVVLPPGLVHRNFNASAAVERHVSLLVPEPREGEIFDYAVTIHEREAELLQSVPA